MAGCCARDYERLFSARFARRDARRYRRRGVRGSARTLVELAGDVAGGSVLEVGGGIGAIGLELLAAGAARATNIDISRAYEAPARDLIAERGLAGRVERRTGDFAAEAPSVGSHDVVVLHRVVCCYPDVDALVGAAATHARNRLLLTYPRERGIVRIGAGLVNAVQRLSRSTFRFYVHPAARIRAAAAREGLTLVERREGAIWESAAYARG